MNVAAQVFEKISDSPFGKRPSVGDLKLRVASVSPQIKARAHATEKAGAFRRKTSRACAAIGYFDIVKPRAFGGYEYDFDVLVDLNIDLAKACASTAWVGGLARRPPMADCKLSRAGPARCLGSQPRMRLPADPMRRQPRRLRLEGGYRLERALVVRQRLRQCAMVAVCSAAAVGGREADRLTPAFLLVPASDYLIDDTWNVVGLAGTGSKTLVLDGRLRARASGPDLSPRPHPAKRRARALCG